MIEFFGIVAVAILLWLMVAGASALALLWFTMWDHEMIGWVSMGLGGAFALTLLTVAL